MKFKNYEVIPQGHIKYNFIVVFIVKKSGFHKPVTRKTLQPGLAKEFDRFCPSEHLCVTPKWAGVILDCQNMDIWKSQFIFEWNGRRSGKQEIVRPMNCACRVFHRFFVPLS